MGVCDTCCRYIRYDGKLDKKIQSGLPGQLVPLIEKIGSSTSNTFMSLLHNRTHNIGIVISERICINTYKMSIKWTN